MARPITFARQLRRLGRTEEEIKRCNLVQQLREEYKFYLAKGDEARFISNVKALLNIDMRDVLN